MMSLMDSMGFGGYSPAMNFMLMPLSYDMQKFQMIEFNDFFSNCSHMIRFINKYSYNKVSSHQIGVFSPT